MSKRVVSGILCACILFLVMFLSSKVDYILNLVVAFISGLSVYELLVIKKEFKFNVLSVSSMIFSISRSLVGPGTKWHAILYTYMVICFIISMKRFIKNRKQYEKSVWNVCFVFFLNVIISVCLGTIVEIRNFGGIFLSTMTLGIAWTCDIGAYCFGKKFGKHKLCPYISPKKTVEGAVGGILFSSLCAFLFCLFCDYFFKIRTNYLVVVFMSLLGAPVSVLGDLCFSLIKRLLIIKDFSNIIPGHGGVLDRFDSVIFLSPFIFIFIHIFDLFK